MHVISVGQPLIAVLDLQLGCLLDWRQLQPARQFSPPCRPAAVSLVFAARESGRQHLHRVGAAWARSGPQPSGGVLELLLVHHLLALELA